MSTTDAPIVTFHPKPNGWFSMWSPLDRQAGQSGGGGINPVMWPTKGNIVSDNGTMHAALGDPLPPPAAAVGSILWCFNVQLPTGFYSRIALHRSFYEDEARFLDNDHRPRAWQIHLQNEDSIDHGVSTGSLIEQFQIWIRSKLNQAVQQVASASTGPQTYRSLLEERIAVQDSRIHNLCDRGQRALERKDLEVALASTLEAMKARDVRECIANQLETYDAMQKEES